MTAVEVTCRAIPPMFFSTAHLMLRIRSVTLLPSARHRELSRKCSCYCDQKFSMKSIAITYLSFALFSFIALGLLSVPIDSEAADKRIASKSADVDGVQLHYLMAGQGPAVLLLHGYAETSRIWRPLIPKLAEKFTVIAPDLPGIGDSAIPKDGLDMKTAAIRVHELAKSLGITKARVVGHDIGLMVAYAYAAQFPSEVEKLVVMDAFLPGVGAWESVYNDPAVWHFRFNGPTPEALVQGREDSYFAYFWNDLAADK